MNKFEPITIPTDFFLVTVARRTYQDDLRSHAWSTVTPSIRFDETALQSTHALTVPLVFARLLGEEFLLAARLGAVGQIPTMWKQEWLRASRQTVEGSSSC